MGLYLSLKVIEGADHEFFLRCCTDPLGCTGEGGSGLKLGFKADFENSYLLKYKS